MNETEGPQPFDAEFTEDTRSELGRKVDEALDRFARTNADERVRARMRSLHGMLTPAEKPLDLAGLLAMKQAMGDHIEWLESPAGRAETATDVLSMHLDVAATLGDLIACYPEARAIASNYPAP